MKPYVLTVDDVLHHSIPSEKVGLEGFKLKPNVEVDLFIRDARKEEGYDHIASIAFDRFNPISMKDLFVQFDFNEIPNKNHFDPNIVILPATLVSLNIETISDYLTAAAVMSVKKVTMSAFTDSSGRYYIECEVECWHDSFTVRIQDSPEVRKFIQFTAEV